MIKYNDKNIDFQLVCKAIYFDKIKRKEFFDFLEANRSSISDESILGILDYLKINNWDFLKLQSKMNRLETSNNSSNLFKNQNPKLLVAVMIFSFLGLIILKQLYYGNKPSNNIIFEPTEIGVSNMLNTNQRVVFNGVDQAQFFATLPAALQVGQSAKSAMAYKTNDFALVGGGATVATDTQGNVPVVDRLDIVAAFNGTVSNMYIKKLSYYPARLTDTQLQALTS